jgi:autotransporter-associated beta strand protein
VRELGANLELTAAPPAEEAVTQVVTIFRELRAGQTLDGKNKLKQPSGVLSTAEAISVLANGMALAGNFGSGPMTLNGSGATSGPYAAFPGAMRNDRNIAPITISNGIVLQTDTLIHVQANAGTGSSSTPLATNTLVGNISGPGKLTFTAPNADIDQGFLVLNGSNTYSGGTLVSGGILVADGAGATFGTGDVTIDHAASPSSIARAIIRSGVLNAIADTATLSLSGGGTAGVADQGWIILETGINEVVGALKLAGVLQPPGTYGSTASAARNMKILILLPQ